MRVDAVLGAIVKRKGACGLAERPTEPCFRSLLRALVSQQLSVKAAATIFSRFLALFPDGAGSPAPEKILEVPVERLREVGLSRQKASYLRDLSTRVAAGTLRLDQLDELSDEEVTEALTAVKGVGRWTAEMFLIFNLLRPNVLPLDDLGLLKAVSRHYFDGAPITGRDGRAQVAALAVAWEPWRSVATWYLWRSLDPVPVEY